MFGIFKKKKKDDKLAVENNSGFYVVNFPQSNLYFLVHKGQYIDWNFSTGMYEKQRGWQYEGFARKFRSIDEIKRELPRIKEHLFGEGKRIIKL